jgi:hypothetical protein
MYCRQKSTVACVSWGATVQVMQQEAVGKQLVKDARAEDGTVEVGHQYVLSWAQATPGTFCQSEALSVTGQFKHRAERGLPESVCTVEDVGEVLLRQWLRLIDLECRRCKPLHHGAISNVFVA